MFEFFVCVSKLLALKAVKWILVFLLIYIAPRNLQDN